MTSFYIFFFKKLGCINKTYYLCRKYENDENIFTRNNYSGHTRSGSPYTKHCLYKHC